VPAAPKSEARRNVRIPDVPRNIDGAIRLAGWAAVSVARGVISEGEAKAITTALREFRELLGVRDADKKLAAAQATLAEMRALRAGGPTP
jgi:hypothetical protein